MMEKGNLPPELQVLYGVCLMGKGGNDFLVEKLLQAISSLDDECIERTQLMLNYGATDNISLDIFRQGMMETLNRPAALVFVSDLVLKMNKEERWADRLLPIFEAFLNEIENCEKLNMLQINPSGLSLYMSTKRNRHVTILIATLRMQTYKAQQLMGPNADADKINDASKLATCIIDLVYRYQKVLLRETDARELCNDSIEVSALS